MPGVRCKRCGHNYSYGPPIYVAPRCPRCAQDQSAPVVPLPRQPAAALQARPLPVVPPALIIADDDPEFADLRAPVRPFLPPFENAEVVALAEKNPSICTGMVLTWVVSGKTDAGGKLFKDLSLPADDDEDSGHSGFEGRMLSRAFLFRGAIAHKMYTNTLALAQEKKTAPDEDSGNLQSIRYVLTKLTHRGTMCTGYRAFGAKGSELIRTVTSVNNACYLVVSVRGGQGQHGNHCVGFRGDGQGGWQLFDPNTGIFKLTAVRLRPALEALCRPWGNGDPDGGAIGEWSKYQRFAAVIVS